MRYELLINGYTWFTDQLNYSPDMKLSDDPKTSLNEGIYTRNEVKQMKDQLNDYQTLGFNRKLQHLNRTGIHIGS